MSVRQRLRTLERNARKRLRSRSRWFPPILTVGGEGTPEDNVRIAEVRREAESAGWRPERGTPFVVVVHLPDDDGDPRVEGS